MGIGVIYDIFIRGVVPLGIVALIAFLLRSYWKKYKGVPWKHIFGLISIFLGLFFIVIFGIILGLNSSNFTKYYDPTNLKLIGGGNTEICNIDKCIWKIKGESTIFIPLKTKKRFIETLNIEYTSDRKSNLTLKIEDTTFNKKILQSNEAIKMNILKKQRMRELVPSAFVIENKIVYIRTMVTGFPYTIALHSYEDFYLEKIEITTDTNTLWMDILSILVGVLYLLVGIKYLLSKKG